VRQEEEEETKEDQERDFAYLIAESDATKQVATLSRRPDTSSTIYCIVPKLKIKL